MRRTPQQERGRQRVDAILDAAAVVFAEVGYEAATTNAIAARAHTSIGSLYQFFPDKLAIFQALDERYCEQCYALSAEVFSPQKARLPLATMIGELIDAFAGFYAQPGFRVVLTQNPTARFNPCEEDKSLKQEIVRLLAALLSARNPKLPPEECDLLADVCRRIATTLLLAGVLGDEAYRQQMIAQTKCVLVAYLEPHLEPKNTTSSACPDGIDRR
ncbi:TetR family transcriptional regulator [Gloeobacter kilaueensis JS1]|uniref:TetR family transcriptional regulator n=2 Tax=Gloeobacter TaxID=33071 RepID=U5QG45_GLOK1|nr:TetR family transcriptional regulator [Gloeobacter kilaueensis JS1]